MSYLLDTNVLIEIENGNEEIIRSLLSLSREDFFISVFTYSEFYFGLMNKSEQNRKKYLERLQNYSILHTDLNSAELYSQIKYHLFTKGVTIPDFDLLIACQAISNNLKLISMDADFKKIPQLKITTEVSGMMVFIQR